MLNSRPAAADCPPAEACPADLASPDRVATDTRGSRYAVGGEGGERRIDSPRGCAPLTDAAAGGGLDSDAWPVYPYDPLPAPTQ